MEEVELADPPNKGPRSARGPEQGAVTPAGRNSGRGSTAAGLPTGRSWREEMDFPAGTPASPAPGCPQLRRWPAEGTAWPGRHPSHDASPGFH